MGHGTQKFAKVEQMAFQKLCAENRYFRQYNETIRKLIEKDRSPGRRLISVCRHGWN